MTTTKLTQFTQVDDAQVIISVRGVYQPVDLYKRGEQLFAKFKGGFIRLLSSQGTTVSSIIWKEIEGVTFTEEYNGPKIVPVAPPKSKLKVAK